LLGQHVRANEVDCGQLVRALLATHNKGQGLAEALLVLDWMDEQCIVPSHQLIAMLLSNTCLDRGDCGNCSSGTGVDVGRRLHARVRGVTNNFLAAALISMYARCGFLEDAVAVFVELITAADGGDYQRQPTSNVTRALVSACRRCGQPGRALLFMRDIDRFGLLRGDEACFQQLAAACGEAGDASGAMILFDYMRQGLLGFTPDTVSCGQLIKACLTGSEPSSSVRPASSQVTNAVRILEWMDRSCVPQTTHHYTMILEACAKNAEIDVGRWLHSRLIRSDSMVPITHDFIGAALISLYAKCGFLEEAVLVYQDFMDRRDREKATGLAPPEDEAPSTRTAMLMALGQHGRGKEALALFNDMTAENPALIDNVLIVAVLNACSHAGLADEALRILQSIEEGHFPRVVISNHHRNCVVDALSRAGRLIEAEHFIHTRIPHPDVITWKTLLGACRNHRNHPDHVTLAERIIHRINKLDPTDVAAGVMLGNIFAGVCRWEDTDKVRQAMHDQDLLKTPGMSWIVNNGQRHVFTVEDNSHPQIKEIHQVLHRLSKLMKDAGFMPNTTVVLRKMPNEEAKIRHLCHHSEKLAIGLGLISTPEGTTLRVYKNLRVCPDCHEATKVISQLTKREIIVRDANRFHHFKEGLCSCNDYW